MIRNTEHLTGFTDTEIEIIALLARYHRKSAPKPSHADFMRLDHDDRELVRSLAALLRVAFGFDRSHDGRVASLRVHDVDGALEIEAVGAGRANLTLERYAANERRGLLEAVFAAPGPRPLTPRVRRSGAARRPGRSAGRPARCGRRRGP